MPNWNTRPICHRCGKEIEAEFLYVEDQESEKLLVYHWPCYLEEEDDDE